jgi:hypothetical protein
MSEMLAIEPIFLPDASVMFKKPFAGSKPTQRIVPVTAQVSHIA